jgi:hypothetical protein
VKKLITSRTIELFATQMSQAVPQQQRITGICSKLSTNLYSRSQRVQQGKTTNNALEGSLLTKANQMQWQVSTKFEIQLSSWLAVTVSRPTTVFKIMKTSKTGTLVIQIRINVLDLRVQETKNLDIRTSDSLELEVVESSNASS